MEDKILFVVKNLFAGILFGLGFVLSLFVGFVLVFNSIAPLIMDFLTNIN